MNNKWISKICVFYDHTDAMKLYLNLYPLAMTMDLLSLNRYKMVYLPN